MAPFCLKWFEAPANCQQLVLESSFRVSQQPRSCTPSACEDGEMDMGTACSTSNSSTECLRTCRMQTPSSDGYGDFLQSLVTCSGDLTGHASDQLQMVRSSWDWTPSSNQLVTVDLWGGGGGGTGSVVRTQQTSHIEVTSRCSSPDGL